MTNYGRGVTVPKYDQYHYNPCNELGMKEITFYLKAYEEVVISNKSWLDRILGRDVPVTVIEYPEQVVMCAVCVSYTEWYNKNTGKAFDIDDRFYFRKLIDEAMIMKKIQPKPLVWLPPTIRTIGQHAGVLDEL